MMDSYNNSKKIKLSNMKKNFIGISISLMATGLAILPKYQEHKEVTKIEDNANIEAIRSFKDIKKDKMGKYLENEIEKLYDKYPDLDDIIFKSNEKAREIEFIDDIYRLYKAFMVDKSEKEIEEIENVKVTIVDQIILQSDLIKEGNDKIIETHKEQYKMITNSYLEAKETDKDGTKLAKEMYELLTLELGLEENVLTSQEIQEEIENKGVYYDDENNIVYTKEGKQHIVIDKNEESKNSKKEKDDELEIE